METVKDINRWWLNPGRMLRVLVERRILRWHKVPVLFGLARAQTRRKFASLGFRLPLQAWYEIRFRGCRNGKSLAASHADKFGCREDFDDRLSVRTPCRDIDRNMKKFAFRSCLDIGEHICRIRVLAESLSVVRKQSVQRALARPFKVLTKVFWPRSMGELKSIPVIFSHNLLCLLVLQQFNQTLTGQQ
jgi:hypothetical protein